MKITHKTCLIETKYIVAYQMVQSYIEDIEELRDADDSLPI